MERTKTESEFNECIHELSKLGHYDMVFRLLHIFHNQSQERFIEGAKMIKEIHEIT